MPVQTVLNIIIGLGLIGLLMYRQLRWRAFDPARALSLPVILGGVGLVLLARSGTTSIATVDVAFVTVELLLSVGIGTAMGFLTTFREAPDAPHTVQIRAGAWGASLWFVLIAARVGLDLIAGSLGGHLVTQVGVILLLLGVSRAASARVVRTRLRQPVASAS